jgi:hypothetical protein
MLNAASDESLLQPLNFCSYLVGIRELCKIRLKGSDPEVISPGVKRDEVLIRRNNAERISFAAVKRVHCSNCDSYVNFLLVKIR